MATSRKEYIEAAEAAFLNLAKKAALKNLALKYGAWVLTGPMGWLTGFVIGEVLEAGIEKGDVGIFFVYVDLRVHGQETDFVQTAINWNRIKNTGTQEQKDEAEKKLIDSFDAFIKLTNY